jgi:uncharacterized protein (TIRG00374 family)
MAAVQGRRPWSAARFWAGLAVGSLALVLAARAVSLDTLVLALRQVEIPWVILTMALSLLAPLLKAQRWRWLFHPTPITLGLGRLSSLIVIGQAVNFLVPGRFGEVVRTYLTGEETELSKWFVLGTIGAEKLIDLLVLVLLTLALVPFIALPETMAAQVDTVLVLGLAVAIGAATLLGGRALWLRLARAALRPLPAAMAARWLARIEAGLDGLSALANPRAAVAIWGWTAVFWLVAGLTNLCLLVAFGLPASPVMALFLLVLLQGGIAVPSTPGKIGVFQWLCMIGLSVFGVPAAVGFAYGLVLYGIVVGGVTLWAALAVWRRSLDLRSLAGAAAGLE